MKAEPIFVAPAAAQRRATGSWPALLFTVIVAAAAAWAFSPRPMPPFAPTFVHPDGFLANGLAQQGKRVIAVGEQGEILLADDLQGPWRQASVEPQRGSTLTQVRFVGPGVAIAVGHDGWVLRSTDGGETWKEAFFIKTKPQADDAPAGPGGLIAPPPGASTSAEPPDSTAAEPPPDASTSAEPPDSSSASAWNPEPPSTDDSGTADDAAQPLLPDPLLGIAGPFDGHLFAIGGFGLMLRSDDDGKTWHHVVSDTIGDHHLNAMLRAADGSLLIAGERGLLARSTDSGQSWTVLPQVYDGSFFGALALPSKTLLVFGMRGHVFRSTDKGQTWQASTVPGNASLFGGTVTRKGQVVLVGAGSTVMVSDDDGQTFRAEHSGAAHDYAAVLPVTTDRWLVAGDAGLQLVSAGETDGDAP
ncbi:WD40/YVTN/BNR-like repeat-containing protein [Solimonas marina]|uniref:Photosynthesis system II assembly factor Ycf48/Hcf136-like domain-containing protein n=1 Tax=Solimonas marina TaxID=2714601 RepID=A0A969W8J6_9GAMM|nr:YCF48-related protein [Solimonas marina]NKF20926.1 hypothetical protein [Solimonas marina]